MVSYPSKHVSQSFSGKPFVHIQLYWRHITWKLQVIHGRSAYRKTAILLDAFFVWFRLAWGIWLESYGPRHALFVLWYNTVCIYCKHVRTSLFRTLLHIHLTTNSRTLWLHTTHQMTALLPTQDIFIRTMLATVAKLHFPVFFQLHVVVYANCSGHFKFWEDFWLISGSRSPFPVETSGFTGT